VAVATVAGVVLGVRFDVIAPAAPALIPSAVVGAVPEVRLGVVLAVPVALVPSGVVGALAGLRDAARAERHRCRSAEYGQLASLHG
jgi:hypothetical protein